MKQGGNIVGNEEFVDIALDSSNSKSLVSREYLKSQLNYRR